MALFRLEDKYAPFAECDALTALDAFLAQGTSFDDPGVQVVHVLPLSPLAAATTHHASAGVHAGFCAGICAPTSLR